jgi:hypothetical protein
VAIMAVAGIMMITTILATILATVTILATILATENRGTSPATLLLQFQFPPRSRLLSPLQLSPRNLHHSLDQLLHPDSLR